MKRILLIGATGQVGQELRHTLAPLGDFMGVGREQLDLTRSSDIRQLIRGSQPNVIVNAAAYTAVDKAETEPDLAHSINGLAPTVMAEEAQQLGAGFIHLSTDYVFDGSKSTPYTERDATNPTNVYGQSKWAGEEGVQTSCDRHLILRTAWVYGAHGKGNFVKTMLRLGADREEIRVVSDQVGSPTWARDIAQTIAQLLPRVCPDQGVPPLTGTVHFTNSGVASWYDFAVAIFEEARSLGFPLQLQRVIPITTLEYPTPARRPSYSVLSLSAISSALGAPPAHWRQSLRSMLTKLYSQTYEGTYSVRR